MRAETLARLGCCGASVVSSSEQGHALGPEVVNVSEYACVCTTPSDVVAPVTVSTYDVASANGDVGMNVRVVLVSATVPAPGPDGPVRVIVPLPDTMGSLHVTLTAVLVGTDRAASPGEALITAGGMLSTVVVLNTTSTK